LNSGKGLYGFDLSGKVAQIKTIISLFHNRKRFV
jgi:hypothetical protein